MLLSFPHFLLNPVPYRLWLLRVCTQYRLNSGYTVRFQFPVNIHIKYILMVFDPL